MKALLFACTGVAVVVCWCFNRSAINLPASLILLLAYPLIMFFLNSLHALRQKRSGIARLLVMLSVFMLTGCAAYTENFAKYNNIAKPPVSDEKMLQMYFDKNNPAEKMAGEMVLKYIARSMVFMEYPDLTIYSCEAVNVAFADSISGGGINQEWLDSLMMTIRELKPDAIVKTSPRKHLILIPDPSVHLTIRVGRDREQGYIIAPKYFEKIILD